MPERWDSKLCNSPVPSGGTTRRFDRTGELLAVPNDRHSYDLWEDPELSFCGYSLQHSHPQMVAPHDSQMYKPRSTRFALRKCEEKAPCFRSGMNPTTGRLNTSVIIPDSVL